MLNAVHLNAPWLLNRIVLAVDQMSRSNCNLTQPTAEH